MAQLFLLLGLLAAVVVSAVAADVPGPLAGCLSGSVPPLLEAPYAAGVITVDGSDEDWRTFRGTAFPLRGLQGLAYPVGNGALEIKVAHDGRDVFFLLRFTGNYVFSAQNGQLNAAVGLLFGVGANATFLNMGGCPQAANTCTANSCSGFEVDVMNFQPKTDAVPGRLYGYNLADLYTGKDRFGHLIDMYAYNPLCKWVDGPKISPESPMWGATGAQNDWIGAWGHTSLNLAGQSPYTFGSGPFGVNGSAGDYVFEFQRPLVTPDKAQQDVQLRIGEKHRFGAALWYPLNNTPWQPHDHFLAHCDWIDLELLPGTGAGAASVGATGATVLGTASLVLSLGAVVGAAYAGCLLRRQHGYEGLARLT